jgi:hypothetical protein
MTLEPQLQWRERLVQIVVSGYMPGAIAVPPIIESAGRSPKVWGGYDPPHQWMPI